MLPADLSIRKFDWGDVPAITAIYGHYVDNTVITFDTTRPTESEIAEKYGHMAEIGHPVLIAESGGETVGYAYASVYRPRHAYRFTCEDTIYLAPTAIGRGIGSALMGRLILDAQAFGFKQMIAVIAAGTEGSVRLHEKHGFATLGTFPDLGFKFDRWVGIIHMQRAL